MRSATPKNEAMVEAASLCHPPLPATSVKLVDKLADVMKRGGSLRNGPLIVVPGVLQESTEVSFNGGRRLLPKEHILPLEGYDVDENALF